MTTNLTKFKHLFTVSLDSADDIALLGVLPSGAIYAETFAEEGEEEDENVIRWRITADGQSTERFPEAHADFATLPPDLIEPSRVPQSHPWNFTGARQRGLREADRINALVRPLTIMQKMPLIAHLGLSIAPMQLLGVAESRLLAQVVFPTGDGILCRLLRFAYALPSVAQDADGLPYDYDTLPLYLIHAYDPQAEELPPIEECLGDFAGINMSRPMDCVYHNGRLVVADAGDEDTSSQVIVFSQSR